MEILGIKLTLSKHLFIDHKNLSTKYDFRNISYSQNQNNDNPWLRNPFQKTKPKENPWKKIPFQNKPKENYLLQYHLQNKSNINAPKTKLSKNSKPFFPKWMTQGKAKIEGKHFSNQTHQTSLV